jgi:NADPH:quinone reductase-like Zn-dependent oxidoreductase
MKAIVMWAQGGPEVLVMEEWPTPVPGPEEALVEVRAVGISFHDVVQRNGAFQRGVKFPMIIGNEISGVVTAVGERVSTLAVGDYVCTKAFHSCGMCRLCRTGMETACKKRKSVHGGYAEKVALHEEVLVKFPPSISFDVACMLGVATGVAVNAVRDVAKVKIGETVLVTGASGGLGLPTIQLCRASGAQVVAVTRSEAKREALVEAGANHVVVAGDGVDFSEQVKQIVGDDGVNVVIDNVGSRVFTPSFKSLAVGGRYAFVGQLFREDIKINPARIFFKRAVMLGVGSVRRDQLEDAVQLVAQGVLTPRVAEAFPLEEAARAHALVEAGEVVGRVVLRPTQ